MINPPEYSHYINRVQPVDNDLTEDQSQERKRRRVLYQGRKWAEEEEALPVQPQEPSSLLKNPRSSAGVYADRKRLDKATALLRQLTTLEEKVAQLCFLQTDAQYDTALQHEIELLIQMWQIGGVFFQTGHYKREAYLIERYQEVSKTALLIANDFTLSLNYHIEKQQLKDLPEQHFSDFGKVVMGQNKRLGVHIQFTQESLTQKQARGFCRGVREAGGIVGKHTQAANITPAATSVFEHTDQQVQQTIGFKTLTFFDATASHDLLDAFNSHYDIFLLSKDNVSEAIRTLCMHVRTGKISEAELDKRVMKALIIKSQFFQ